MKHLFLSCSQKYIFFLWRLLKHCIALLNKITSCGHQHGAPFSYRTTGEGQLVAWRKVYTGQAGLACLYFHVHPGNTYQIVLGPCSPSLMPVAIVLLLWALKTFSVLGNHLLTWAVTSKLIGSYLSLPQPANHKSFLQFSPHISSQFMGRWYFFSYQNCTA